MTSTKVYGITLVKTRGRGKEISCVCVGCRFLRGEKVQQFILTVGFCVEASPPAPNVPHPNYASSLPCRTLWYTISVVVSLSSQSNRCCFSGAPHINTGQHRAVRQSSSLYTLVLLYHITFVLSMVPYEAGSLFCDNLYQLLLLSVLLYCMVLYFPFTPLSKTTIVS